LDKSGTDGFEVKIQGWPVGTKLEYKVGNQLIAIEVQDENFPLKICGDSEEELRAIIDSLRVTSPPNGVENFDLSVSVGTYTDGGKKTGSYVHNVDVRYSPSQTPSRKPSRAPSQDPSNAPSFFPFLYTYDGKSVLVEDQVLNIGPNIIAGWSPLLAGGPQPPICSVTLSDFPMGTYLSRWETNPSQGTNEVVMTTNYTKTFDVTILSRLNFGASPQSDQDFNLTVTLRLCGNFANGEKSFQHPVNVLAIADAPQVKAVVDTVSILETDTVPLRLAVARSNDTDGSESMVVVFQVDPSQGILVGVNTSLVSFVANTTSGVYTLIARGGDPASTEALLNAHFTSGFIQFRPNEQSVTSKSIEAIVNVTVISIENASGEGSGLAFPNSTLHGTISDMDTKRESSTTTIRIQVSPKSASPSYWPSSKPSSNPSALPTIWPSRSSSNAPSASPSVSPSRLPSVSPSKTPSSSPSDAPSYFGFPYTYNGASVVVEDQPRIIGPTISGGWSPLPPSSGGITTPPEICFVTLSGFPINTTISWNASVSNGNVSSVVVTDDSFNVTLSPEALETLMMTAPPQSDVDFIITVTLKTCENYQNDVASFPHPVTVLARADAPQVIVTPPQSVLQTLENEPVPLTFGVLRSNDSDSSETLVVELWVNPSEGTLVGNTTYPNVTFIQNTTSGRYRVEASGGDPAYRESLLNAYLGGGSVMFQPAPGITRANPTAVNVTVVAVSSEGAEGEGIGLASANSTTDGTVGDLDTKRESALAVIVINVRPDSESPSAYPSRSPSSGPSSVPSSSPSLLPSSKPSARPSASPSVSPSRLPSVSPSKTPSSSPSDAPSYFGFPYTYNGASVVVVEDNPANFVRLFMPGSILQIYDGTSWVNVAELEGFTTFNATALYASGNLLL